MIRADYWKKRLDALFKKKAADAWNGAEARSAVKKANSCRYFEFICRHRLQTCRRHRSPRSTPLARNVSQFLNSCRSKIRQASIAADVADGVNEIGQCQPMKLPPSVKTMQQGAPARHSEIKGGWSSPSEPG